MLYACDFPIVIALRDERGRKLPNDQKDGGKRKITETANMEERQH